MESSKKKAKLDESLESNGDNQSSPEKSKDEPGKPSEEALATAKPKESEDVPTPERGRSRKRKASESKPAEITAPEELENSSKVSTDESSANDNDSDMNMPPVQTMGKGKRARIPNKRYSDIMLSPTRMAQAQLSQMKTIENGAATPRIEKVEKSEKVITEKLDKHEKIEAELEALEDPLPNPNVSHLKSRSNSSSPALKKAKVVDLNNPNFQKPFLHGWKRELVYRAVQDDHSARRNGDIYYYTPSGKKVRSMREVAENLRNKELCLDDFTFFKAPLGLDNPELEIIRDAKIGKKGTPIKSGPPIKAIKTPGRILSPKVASPKVAASPKSKTPTPPKSPSKAVNSEEKGNKRTKNQSNIKVKLPPGKAKADKGAKQTAKQQQQSDDTMDVDVSPSPPKRPTNRKSASKAATPASKRGSASATKPKSTRAARVSTRVPSATNLIEKADEPKFMDSYLQNLSYGYSTMLYVFQYLKVQDLLRAGCVCTMWRDIANHPSLWRTVRMKNSQVHSFEGLANTLQKHGTVHLDLRKMLLPNNGGDDIWPEFSKAIEKARALRKIELCRCPASVVEQLAVTNPDLEVINAVTIKCENMSLDQLSNLKKLKELRLKSTGGLTLTSDITALKELVQLKHLSLTSIKDLHKLDLSVIASLTDLESLDLGECSDFPRNFGDEILIKLTKLEKLRLEKGQNNCHTFEILNAVRDMPKLEQLELVNFDIKNGFDLALGACANIKKLLIIPTYISQSATTNHMVLGGVLRLQSTLSHFVWGVTLELLRVTELFVDQCEDPEKKDKKEKKPIGNGDSIPVLKPVPLIVDKDDHIPPAHDPPQVEILPLPNLQKLLLQSLPTTRVKILKIPFHATWRQSITDTVN